MKELNAILTIALRDFTKLLRDRTRILVSFIFPVIFIGVLGGGFQSSFAQAFSFNMQHFIFMGVFAQTFFQSTASGIISLIQDRESDFSQEIFVSPISRYTIIFGKIVGETLVSLVQVIGIIIFGFIIGVPLTLIDILSITGAGLVASIFGGAFGTIIMANLSNQRAASQIFPFILLPQIFLGGVFTPIPTDPSNFLYYFARIAPLTYAVDLVRHAYYWSKPEYAQVVFFPIAVDLTVIGVLFLIFMSIGTYMFVKNERNK